MTRSETQSYRHENRAYHRADRWTGPVIILSLLFVVTFLMGGGSRYDIQSLMMLRPLAALALGLGLFTLPLERIKAYRGLFAFAFACIILVVLHLIPLPPSIWQSLPGREIIVEIDRLAGFGDIWRPFSMDPPATWNALWSLIIPAAVLVLAVQLDVRDHCRLLAVILLIGCASAALALIQILGDPKGAAYLYRITNYGSAVGLFANRNHQAVFLACLAPIALAWAGQNVSRSNQKEAARKTRFILIGLFMVFLVPLIVVTGSRAGLLTMLISWPLAFWIYSTRKSSKAAPKSGVKGRNWISAGLIGLALILLISVTWFFNRGLALERLFGQSAADDLRAPIADVTLNLSSQYAPWGSGIGSFKTIFRLHESSEFLDPQFVNHAHNDYLELLMTAGYPGIALLAAAICGVIWAAYKLVSIKQYDREALVCVRLARCGFSILILLFVASIGDYPLRVPSIQALAILAAVWLFQPIWGRGIATYPVKDDSKE